MKIRILLEPIRGGYVASSRDDVGELASAASCSPQAAVEKVKRKTLAALDVPPNAVRFDVQGLHDA